MISRSRRRPDRDQSGRLKARLFSMIMMLFVIGMMYSRARDPKTWTWLVPETETEEVATAPLAMGPGTNQTGANQPGTSGPEAGVAAAPVATETIVPGPTDQDADQQDEIKRLLSAVTDMQKLADVEMPAYWRFLGWARAQSYQQLASRAQRDVPLTKLHELPDQYRGKPIRLKLNVRRMLDFDAPKNSAGVSKVYEAWGWTDESRARPYVVVFSELPPGVKVGSEVEYELRFVGYFLKWMKYETFKGASQSAPLLVGRVDTTAVRSMAPQPTGMSLWDLVFLFGGMGIVTLGFWSAFRRNAPRRRLVAAEGDEATAFEFFQSEGEIVPDHEGSARGSRAASDSSQDQRPQNNPFLSGEP